MMKMFFWAAACAAFLFIACSSEKGAVDVNSFPTECLKNCALGFNGCKSLSNTPEATTQCENYFSRCKNECEAKDKPTAAPAPVPAAPAAPAPAAQQ